jgi:hypothetical protein
MSPQQQVQIMLGGIAAIAGAAVQQQQQQTKVATTTTAPGTEMAQPKVTAQKGGKNGSRTTGTCGKQLKMNGTGGEGQKSLAATKTGQGNTVQSIGQSKSKSIHFSKSNTSIGSIVFINIDPIIICFLIDWQPFSQFFVV